MGAGALLALAACASTLLPSLPAMIVNPPDRDRPRRWTGTIADAVQESRIVDEELFLDGADPGVRLAVALIEPKHLDIVTTGSPRRRSEFRLAIRELEELPPLEPRGTLILLHGWGMDRWMMSMWGAVLADAGYRIFMPDMRAHGRSSGEHVTFGVRESADVRAMIDQLEAQGRIAGKLGLMGVSMGGTTALLAAADDPRVQTVVALEPMGRLEEVLPRFVERRMEGFRWFLTDERIAGALMDAESLTGVSVADIDARRVMPEIEVPVLLIHGGEDHLIPAEFSRQLHALASPGSELLVVEDAGHYDLPRRVDEFFPLVSEWLASRL